MDITQTLNDIEIRQGLNDNIKPPKGRYLIM